MISQEVIDPVCEKLEKNGIDPEPETVPYDRIGEWETPEGVEDIARAAYNLQAIGRVLLGHSGESNFGLTSPRPLTGFSHEGLLHAVDLLAAKICDDLNWHEKHPRRRVP
jgi:hypothetical protein